MKHEHAKQLEVLIVNINAFENCQLLNNIRHHGWESFVKCVHDRYNYLSSTYMPNSCQLLLEVDNTNHACYLYVKHLATDSTMYFKSLELVRKTKS